MAMSSHRAWSVHFLARLAMVGGKYFWCNWVCCRSSPAHWCHILRDLRYQSVGILQTILHGHNLSWPSSPREMEKSTLVTVIPVSYVASMGTGFLSYIGTKVLGWHPICGSLPPAKALWAFLMEHTRLLNCKKVEHNTPACHGSCVNRVKNFSLPGIRHCFCWITCW
jgi:hypothetical protein